MQSYPKHRARVWWTAAVAFSVTVLVGLLALPVRAEQAKTAKDSVYSAAQAKRGEAIYTEQCSPCHGADLSGGGAPALSGTDFLGFFKVYEKVRVADLSGFLRAAGFGGVEWKRLVRGGYAIVRARKR